MKQLAAFVTIPFVMLFPPLLGWFIGRWLDGKLGTAPIFMFVLIILGVATAIREVYRLIKRFGNGL